jgi:hypothetical protein
MLEFHRRSSENLSYLLRQIRKLYLDKDGLNICDCTEPDCALTRVAEEIQVSLDQDRINNSTEFPRSET